MRVAAVVLFAGLTLIGCGSGPTKPTPPCAYTLSTSSVAFGAEESSGAVMVSTSGHCAWTAQTSAAWIAVTAGTSGSGQGTVSFRVAANTDTAARTATVMIAGQVVTVTQQGLACTYALSPASRSFESAGGTGSVDVAAQGSCAWTATSSAPWVAVVGGSQGTGNGTITFAVVVNTSDASRSATIAVADRVFSLTQSGTSGCTYAIDPDDETFGVSGGTGTVRVSTASGCAWTARSNAGWLRVTAPADGLGIGNQVVSYAVEGNTDADARRGTVSIGDRSLEVTQAGTKTCEYSVSPVEFNYCVHGSGDLAIAVTTQLACPWTASTSVSWITITSGQAGRGSGTIRFQFPNNYGGLARDGRVMVRWPTPTAGQNVRVSQSGCLYGVSGGTAFGSAGGSGRLQVISTPEPYCGGPYGDSCTWSAQSHSAWITITTWMPKSGDSDVSFTVAANDNTSARNGTITVAYKTILITQAGR